MRLPVLLVCLLMGTFLSAQQHGRLVRAGSKKAFIVEGNGERQGWWINPEIRMDVHTITKSVKPIWIQFITDVDSIKVKLPPGGMIEFVVLLNGKDSCFTRIASLPVRNEAWLNPPTHDTIPFTLTEFNNIKLRAIVNKTDTLDLKFDSGTTGLLLTNDAIKNKTHTLHPSLLNNSLQIGTLRWDSLEVYPVEISGQGTDGRFGWDLFDGKIVEIDYDRNIFIVHSKLPAPGKHWSKLAIEYTHSLFCIRVDLQIGNRKYNNRFLFDNGYQRTIMLDTVLMKEQGYPADLPVIKRVIMKNGQGKEIRVITVSNERLNLGNTVLLNIPVQLMTTGNPARFKTHILGNEVLKRFNTILDFQKNRVWLKPNHLFDVVYKDAQ